MATARSNAPRRALYGSAFGCAKLLGAGIEEGGYVARVAGADVEVRHSRARRHLLRVADPLVHIVRRVRQMPADDDAQSDIVERRTHHAGSAAYMLERVTASAAVLDEHCLATAGVSVCRDRGVRAEPPSLLGIFVDHADD